MFILYAVLVGLALGLMLGGRLANLGRLQFRLGGLILVGLLVQVVLFSPLLADRIGDLGPPLYVISTLAVLVAIVADLRMPGMPLIALGAISNMAAIAANGGLMPASASAVAAVGRSADAGYSNSAVLAAPALEPLTDIFAMPAWLPLANVFSIGDVLIAFGVAMVIVIAMRPAAAT
jgi:hypothetical protein